MTKVSYTLRTYVQRQMFRGETSRTPYPRLGAPFTKTGAGPVSLWFEAARFRSPPTRLFGHYWWMDPRCEQSEIAETRVSANINKFIFSPFKWKNFDSHFYSKSLGSFQMMNTTLYIKSVFLLIYFFSRSFNLASDWWREGEREREKKMSFFRFIQIHSDRIRLSFEFL